MKLLRRILLIFIVILILLYSATYVFLVIQGRTLFVKQIESLTNKKTSIDYLGIIPPLNLEIKGLKIEGLIKADAVSISPSILGLITGNIALNSVKIVRPEFIYERFASKIMESTTPITSISKEEPKIKQPLRLIFKRLTIEDGKFNFIDQTVGEGGIKIMVKDLDLALTNLYAFPTSVITNFELKAKVPWQEGQAEGKIEAAGWLNLLKKDMQATLKIEDIDGVYLYPYYSNWVDLEKARIQSAKLNFTSNIQGLDNNVTAQCHLELTDIVRKPRTPEEPEEKAEKIASAIIDVFRALNQGKIVLDFTIRTKMDRPEFGFGNIKLAFEDKLAQGKKINGQKIQDVLALPGKFIEGTFKGVTDVTTAVINGTISAGKQIGKAIEDSFKKEKKE